MTDLEMTRLAAKAMQIDETTHWPGRYDPLNNAAQSFELIEKLRMDARWALDGRVKCLSMPGPDVECQSDWHTYLKRAATQCAANYQLEKEKQA